MRRWAAPLLALAIFASSRNHHLAAALPDQPFDILVRGGTLYDGTGREGRLADLGIRGDRIAAIGDLREAAAQHVIDASGLAVAPGFINMLSWATTSLLADGRSQGDIRQGVTLEVFGEGWSMGPLNAHMKKDLLDARETSSTTSRGPRLASISDTSRIGVSRATWPRLSARRPCEFMNWATRTAARPKPSWNACASWCGTPCARVRSASARRLSMRRPFTPTRTNSSSCARRPRRFKAYTFLTFAVRATGWSKPSMS